MKSKSICWIGILAFSLAPLTAVYASAQDAASPSKDQNTAQNNSDAQVPPLPPLDKLVTATCRQAWHMGGNTQAGFFAIVQELTALSAHNRGVTLPDDKATGARAGEWIRTQAMKDPDQLLYAVVDHAVQYSIAKGRTTKATATATGASPSKN
jgi:hypothetical protein